MPLLATVVTDFPLSTGRVVARDRFGQPAPGQCFGSQWADATRPKLAVRRRAPLDDDGRHPCERELGGEQQPDRASTGLDGLTVRRLADRLGVRAQALYWHFTDKRALLDEMTDILLGPVVADLPPAPEMPDQVWTWLEHPLVAVHDALGTQRDGARIATGAAITPALGTLLELLVTALHVAGFGLADATRLAGLAFQLVLGRTTEGQHRPEPAASWRS